MSCHTETYFYSPLRPLIYLFCLLPECVIGVIFCSISFIDVLLLLLLRGLNDGREFPCESIFAVRPVVRDVPRIPLLQTTPPHKLDKSILDPDRCVSLSRRHFSLSICT